MRVRRANQINPDDENDEIDIGFKYSATYGGWWVDTVAIAEFCDAGAVGGLGHGYISRMYDQQNIGSYVEQTNMSLQPYIYMAGVTTILGKPAVSGSQLGRYLQSADALYTTIPTSTDGLAAFAVAHVYENHAGDYLTFITSDTDYELTKFSLGTGTNQRANTRGRAATTGTIYASTWNTSYQWEPSGGWQITGMYLPATTTQVVRVNGVPDSPSTVIPATNFNTTAANHMQIMGSSGWYQRIFSGYVGETIIYKGYANTSACYLAVEADQKSRWGTP